MGDVGDLVRCGMRRGCLVLALALAMTACGGGGGGSEPEVEEVAGQGEPLLVVEVGDPSERHFEAAGQAIDLLGGFSEALVAVLLAVDGGYSEAQILDGVESGGLRADGVISADDGERVSPDGPGEGLIALAFGDVELVSYRAQTDENFINEEFDDFMDELDAELLQERVEDLETALLDLGVGNERVVQQEIFALVFSAVHDQLEMREIVFLVVTGQVADTRNARVIVEDCIDEAEDEFEVKDEFVPGCARAGFAASLAKRGLEFDAARQALLVSELEREGIREAGADTTSAQADPAEQAAAGTDDPCEESAPFGFRRPSVAPSGDLLDTCEEEGEPPNDDAREPTLTFIDGVYQAPVEVEAPWISATITLEISGGTANVVLDTVSPQETHIGDRVSCTWIGHDEYIGTDGDLGDGVINPAEMTQTVAVDWSDFAGDCEDPGIIAAIESTREAFLAVEGRVLPGFFEIAAGSDGSGSGDWGGFPFRFESIVRVEPADS